MILAIAIAVALLTAALFFHDFFDDWSDFFHCLFSRSEPADGRVKFWQDPEGADDNATEGLKVILYLALVLGIGCLVFAVFSKYFASGI
jgi:hypothetical protein